MNSQTTEAFRREFAKLPKAIQERVRAAYRQFRENPQHNSLQFKKVHQTQPVYSARVNDDYRVLGVRDGSSIGWLWVGKHEEYERILKLL